MPYNNIFRHYYRLMLETMTAEAVAQLEFFRGDCLSITTVLFIYEYTTSVRAVRLRRLKNAYNIVGNLMYAIYVIFKCRGIIIFEYMLEAKKFNVHKYGSKGRREKVQTLLTPLMVAPLSGSLYHILFYRISPEP